MGAAMILDTWSGLGRILLVGTLAYLILVVLLRISGKRTLTRLNASNLGITIALGSTLATALLNNSVALAEGVLALALEGVADQQEVSAVVLEADGSFSVITNSVDDGSRSSLTNVRREEPPPGPVITSSPRDGMAKEELVG